MSAPAGLADAASAKETLASYYVHVRDDPRLVNLNFKYNPKVDGVAGGLQKAAIAYDPSHLPIFGLATKFFRMG